MIVQHVSVKNHNSVPPLSAHDQHDMNRKVQDCLGELIAFYYMRHEFWIQSQINQINILSRSKSSQEYILSPLQPSHKIVFEIKKEKISVLWA